MKELWPCPQLWPHFAALAVLALNGIPAALVQVMEEVATAAEAMDADPEVRAIIITGEGSKAFAAGADIKEMSTLAYSEVRPKNWTIAFLLPAWEPYDSGSKRHTAMLCGLNHSSFDLVSISCRHLLEQLVLVVTSCQENMKCALKDVSLACLL